MVNELRTFFLNIAPTQNEVADLDSTVGEEFTPANYVPVQETAETVAAKKILLGSAPDALTRNFYTSMYMSAVHGDPVIDTLAQALDPRLTYNRGRPAWLDLKPTVNVTKWSPGAADHTLTVSGGPKTDEYFGISRLTYRVGVFTDETRAVLRIQRLTHPTYVQYFELDGAPDSSAFTGTSELTGVLLQISNLDFGGNWRQLTGAEIADAITLTYTSGDRTEWTVEFNVRPGRSLIEIYNQLLESGVFLQKFKLPSETPYSTVNSILTNEVAPIRRLGALILAIAFQNKLKNAK